MRVSVVLVFRVKTFTIIMLCKPVASIIRVCGRPQASAIRAANKIDTILFNRLLNRMNMHLGCENPYNFNCFKMSSGLPST